MPVEREWKRIFVQGMTPEQAAQACGDLQSAGDGWSIAQEAVSGKTAVTASRSSRRTSTGSFAARRAAG
jgi:hypothetical protein